MAIHAGTNLLNDYYDHRRGVDALQPVGPSGVIQEGWLAPRTVLLGGVLLFAVGAVLGLWLVSQAGWPILVTGALSILAGYAYTGGPVPLGYLGVGDLLVFIFMGPVIVLGAYYVQAETVSPTALWGSLPVGALVTAILVVNNLRDLETDRMKGKRTLATFLGPDATRREYLALLVFAYAFVAAGVVARALPALALVTFVSVVQAARVWEAVREETDPDSLTQKGLRGTAALHFRVGAVLALAFVLS